MDNNIKNLIENYERWLCKSITKDFLDKKVEPTNVKLKYAVQISGGLRNFRYTIPWLNHFIIEPLNADIFLHGWSNNMGVEENMSHIKNYKNIKSFIVNDINDIKFDKLKNPNKNIEKVYGNLFNVYECNELRKKYEIEKNIDYDFIIKCRPDVFFFSEFDDNDLMHIYENNSIGIPQDYFGKLWCPLTTDVIAIGKKDIIDRYCKAFNSIEDSIKYQGIGPEDCIHYHLKTNMSEIPLYNIHPNLIIDYPNDLPKELLDSVNTRFNGDVGKLGSQWSY
jgi:hypothetical protein